MNRRTVKIIIVHGLTVAFLIVSCNAEFMGMTPFGFATHLGILLSGGLPLASVYFIAATALVGLSLPAFAMGAAMGAVGIIVNLGIRYIPTVKRKKLWRYIINLCVQPSLYGVMLWLFGVAWLYALLSAVTGTVCGVLVMFAAPLLASGNFVRPTVYGYAGLGTFCIIFFDGLSTVYIASFPIVQLCFALFVLFAGKCRGGASALICGILVGIGSFLPVVDFALFSAFCISAFCASLLSVGMRTLPSMALVIGWATTCFFGNVTEAQLWQIISVSSGALIFAVLPKRVINGVRAFFKPTERLTYAVAAAGMGRKLPERLVRTGEALGEMSSLLLSDYGNKKGAAECLSSSILATCSECPRHESCAVEKDMRYLAENFCTGGNLLGSRILDLPCPNGGNILRQANEVRGRLNAMLGRGEKETQSARSYASRLDSLRRLISQIAKSVTAEYRYDPELSEKLARDLPEYGVACGGALVTGSKSGVALIPSDVTAKKAEKALSSAVGGVRLDRIDSLAPGWTAASFSPAPLFDIIYAVSQSPKSGTACGDSYSVTISGNRAMLSLCDGSGTGMGAAQLSQTTLSLLESHYRAGFDARDGVSSVNAFLSSRVGEEFSAMDIISIDLQTGDADIIKAGSPSTFILRDDSIIKIDGSSLPVGALETASYALAEKKLGVGDIVIIITDGVSDALPNLPEVIASQPTANVQKLADGVLAAAARQGKKDDMSVLAFRIIAK